MADTADLVVLGAWFGTGKRGNIMSIFLMVIYSLLEISSTYFLLTVYKYLLLLGLLL